MLLSQMQGSPFLVYAEYLVFLKGIPKGWMGTLGLGEDVWRIRCQELVYFHVLAISCGPLEVGQK